MRLFIIFFILIQGVVSFAETAESLPGSPVAAETPKTAPDNSDRAEMLSQRYPSIDSLFTLDQTKLDKISTMTVARKPFGLGCLLFANHTVHTTHLPPFPFGNSTAFNPMLAAI